VFPSVFSWASTAAVVPIRRTPCFLQAICLDYPTASPTVWLLATDASVWSTLRQPPSHRGRPPCFLTPPADRFPPPFRRSDFAPSDLNLIEPPRLLVELGHFATLEPPPPMMTALARIIAASSALRWSSPRWPVFESALATGASCRIVCSRGVLPRRFPRVAANGSEVIVTL